MNQVELEREVRQAGRDRARRMMERNEENGRADNNAYANVLYRRYLLPLVDLIREAKAGSGKAGRRAAHVALLEPLDEATAAFLAVNQTLTHLMEKGQQPARSVARLIGKSVQHELALSLFAVDQPDLYWEVVHDLDRRHSKSTSHRYNALISSAKKAEVEVPDWGPAGREQLGLWLLEQLRLLGFVEITLLHDKKRFGVGHNSEYVADFTEEARAVMAQVKDLVEVTTPFHLPFIEQPRDWTSFSEGGYHTPEMRAQMPYCVNLARSNREARDFYKEHPEYTAQMRGAINKLQSVPWQVNRDMLAAIKQIALHMDTDEIIKQAEIPKPKPPEWLEEGMDKTNMTGDQLEQFTEWKRLMREWYTDMKLRGTKWGRFYTARRIADKFAEYDSIYFLYQADFRGRLYAITTGLSPQGSDLSKALLRFANGKPLDTSDAVRWFKINIANKFGVDKVPYDDRIKWVDENEQFIVAMGSDCLSHRGWLEADCPLQFLACCMEYAAWVHAGKTQSFLSHIPVGLDGSCNGLQHFSAMLRDEVGGKATNLLPGVKPNDIYGQVAGVTQKRLEGLDPAKLKERDVSICARWIAHGINRSIVKRSVMTLPYGSTRFSSGDYIAKDYLQHGKAVEFSKQEYQSAANFLSFKVWDSIGEVVIAARSAMDWLQRSSLCILRGAHGGEPQQQIQWDTPSGFRVFQVYDDCDIVTINSKLMGGCRIKVGVFKDSPAMNAHKNGLSPNFVHSMDASHLTICTLACPEIDLAMIHDDYGTHAADAQTLFTRIRETFVRMYEENDPLAQFADRYPGLAAVPPRGSLDLRQVLASPYFFG
ncbi:RNA polymerase [Ralstonia phage RSJ5]|uniref:DNA-directed RNA polymerase n=1 Tax=Ralstonia phage RSJ5 TaxID=1538364 RepID=A0A077KYK0_9CAUD|nr:RNA polymerase [Ralstonia phage RSJ5]BAP34919.1 putative RNA polymerase [Ralstonia phage RSJ5]